MSKPLGLSVDPDLVSCGEATRAVRSLLRLHARTRWFEPGPIDKPLWFEKHVSLTRPHAPSAYAADVRITEQVGGWPEFERLASASRSLTNKLDWKFGVLKPMVKAHSEARGWSPTAHAKRFHGPEPASGDLFLVHDEHALWLPVAGMRRTSPPEVREAGWWYQGFADSDFIEALEWQLAEGTDDVETNPFLPLLLGYAHGQYPFVLDASHVVVFGFREPAS
jgi:hypothetical protein